MRPPMRLLGSVAAVLIVAAITALAFAPAASAHASFLEAQPAPGANLDRPPLEITLEFTEPLNTDLTRIELVDEEDRVLPGELEFTGREGATFRPAGELPRGAFEVSWYTVSTLDGHPLEGTFGFGVRTEALATQTIEQSPLASWGWLRILVRAVLYATLVFFAGGVGAAAMLSPRAPSGWLLPQGLEGIAPQQGVDIRRRIWRRTLAAGWLASVAAAAVAFAETLDATGGLSPTDLGDFLGNQAGLTRVWAAGLLAAAALLARRSPRLAAPPLAASLLAIALGGHATGASPQAPAVLTDWMHLLAGAVWIGGLAQIAVVWVPLARRASLRARRRAMGQVLGRFGRIAFPAFLLVALSGFVNGLIQLEHLTALWQTAYGRVLAVKVALVGLIALASYWHALRLRPRLVAQSPEPDPHHEQHHWRLVSVEPLLGVAVVAAAAALVAFPLPPRDLPEGEAAEATPCEPCPVPEPRPAQLAVAESIGPDIAALWLDSDGRGTLRTYDLHGTPTALPVDLAGGRLTESCGEGCQRAVIRPSRKRIAISAPVGGDRVAAALPISWRPGANSRAARLALRAQATMRALRGVSVRERTTSGPGTLGAADTRLTARRDPQVYRQVFRWGRFSRTARWLGVESVDGRRLVRLAVLDRGAPTWFQLQIDPRTGRVVRELLITSGHFIDRRYSGFEP